MKLAKQIFERPFLVLVWLLAAIATAAMAHAAEPPIATPIPESSIVLRTRVEAETGQGILCELPGGVLLVDRPIVIERIDGGGIVGEHGGNGIEGAGGWYGRSKPTEIRYVGAPTDGPVIQLRGAVNQRVADIVINGNGRAGIGLLVSSEPGWGGGGHRLERVSIIGCKVAMQCGVNEFDINCADITYDQVSFAYCDVGLRTMNHQSVNHSFRDGQFGSLGVMFDMRRGGNLIVTGGHYGGIDTLLRIGTAGPNAGTFRFVGLRPELNGHAKRHARLVDAPTAWLADIVFEGCQETDGPLNEKLADNSNDALYVVGGNTVVTLRNHVHGRRRVVAELHSGAFRDADSRWVYTGPNDASNWRRIVTDRSAELIVSGATNVFGERIATTSRTYPPKGAVR